MKTPRKVTAALLIAALLSTTNIHQAAPLCFMEAFGNLAERYAQVIQDITAWVQLKADKVALDTGRWKLVAATDRQSYALLEMKGSLGSAEKTAAEGGAEVGYQTANAHLTMVNDDTMASTRTSLRDMGKGIGAAVATSGVNDATMASALSGAERAISESPTSVFRAHGYTPAELGDDLRVLLLRGVGDSDPPAIIRPGMYTTKLKNKETGAVAELAVGRRLKDAGHTHIEIGADEIPGPLYHSKVDIMTDTELHQVGLQASTITDKLRDEMTATSQGIKQALDAKPGRTYIFSFAIDDGGRPIQATIDDLNGALTRLYSAEVPPRTPPQTFTSDHFRLLSIDP
jgi:hypothetical protein